MTFVKKPNATAKQSVNEAALTIPCQAWQNAAGQHETAARLRQLPPGLSFGDDVGEPMYYDAARQVLRYRGFMCQASYNYLHRLSLDPEYECAIDHLYMGSAQGGTGRDWRWIVGTAIGLSAAALLLAFWLWPR